MKNIFFKKSSNINFKFNNIFKINKFKKFSYKTYYKRNYIDKRQDIFSVIIPTYNRFELTIESIISVLFQDLSFLKIFIIDDGSNRSFYNYFLNNFKFLIKNKLNLENYLKNILKKDLKYLRVNIINYFKKHQIKNLISNKKNIKFIKKFNVAIISSNRKYKREVYIIRLKNNFGPGYSREIGIYFAKSFYILFLDSDDLFLPQKLKIVKKINKDLYQNLDIYLYNDKIINLNKKHFKIEGNIFFESIKQNRISISSLILRKNIFKTIKYFFNENYFNNFTVMEDYYFYLKITFLFDIGLLSEKLTIIRKWDKIISQTKLNTNYEYYKILSLYKFFINIFIIYLRSIHKNDFFNIIVKDKNVKENFDKILLNSFDQMLFHKFVEIKDKRSFIINEILNKLIVWGKGSLKRNNFESLFRIFVKIIILIYILVEF